MNSEDRYAAEVAAAGERAARRAGASGATGDLPEVLFVCVHNAGRSQMAAAFTRHLSGGRVRVLSAGSAPAAEIQTPVREALREVGLDPGEEFPKRLAAEFVRAADVVVTMGCGDTCPVFPGKRYEDWKIPDPRGQGLDAVREIRDEIRGRVTGLLASLGVVVAGSGAVTGAPCAENAGPSS